MVYVVSLFPCWSETFIVREINALIESGVDVRVLSLKPATEALVHDDAAALLDRVRHPGNGLKAVGSQLRGMLRHPWILLHALANVIADGWRTPRTAAKSVAALLRGMEHVDWLRDFRPDFIHAHWATYPSTVAWALGRMLGRPFGFTCHAHDIFVERQMLTRKIEEASLAVTISRYNIDWLAANVTSCAAERLRLVHCGVDLSTFPWHDEGREPNTILAVGRLDPVKGFETLIDALAALHAGGIEFRCRLVGAGPLDATLRERARNHGIGALVEFTGARSQDDVRTWMRTSTVFAMPSRIGDDGDRDGIPVALMEAMASGCAAVGTRVSGIPELISDGIDGLLVEPRDPVALARALQRLLRDGTLRRRLSIRARERIERDFDSRKEAARLHLLMQDAQACDPAPTLPGTASVTALSATPPAQPRPTPIGHAHE
ncbi:MAG: glycosyltransferase [Luteimonas sp.]|nr:glycosyltransferase [Luteimonas sp.]